MFSFSFGFLLSGHGGGAGGGGIVFKVDHHSHTAQSAALWPINASDNVANFNGIDQRYLRRGGCLLKYDALAVFLWATANDDTLSIIAIYVKCLAITRIWMHEALCYFTDNAIQLRCVQVWYTNWAQNVVHELSVGWHFQPELTMN